MISASIYTVVWNCGKEVVHLYRTVPAKGGWDPGILVVGSTRVPNIPKFTNLARGR